MKNHIFYKKKKIVKYTIRTIIEIIKVVFGLIAPKHSTV